MNRSSIGAKFALAVISTIAILASPSLGDEDDATATRLIIDCGVNSLYLLLRLRSVEVGLSDLRRKFPDTEAHGLSMAEIQAVSARHGVNLRGRRIGRDDLPIDRPMIVLFKKPGANPGHFVVLEPVGVMGKKVMVLDFPRPPRVVEYEELIKGDDWTGLAMAPVGTWERASPWAVSTVGVLIALSAALIRRNRPRTAEA